MPDVSPLERCVGDLGEFDEIWGRRSALVRGVDPEAFDDILNLADVDRIIAMSARVPTVRMVRDGIPLPHRDYCTPLRLGGRTLDDIVDPRKVSDAIRLGSTLVLQSLHRTAPSVASFVAALQAQISHPVQANAYLTPADASGLSEHSDDHDVIVLQLHGSKRWWVDGLGDIEIGAGDSMYVAAGSRHRASTTGDASLHLTLGIVRVTYRDVVERILAEGPRILDQPLPIGYQGRDEGDPPSALAAQLAVVLDEVEHHLGNVEVDTIVARERQRRRRTPNVPGHLTTLLARESVSLETCVRWSAPRPLGEGRSSGQDATRWLPLEDIASLGNSPARLHIGDRVVTVPAVALDAVRLLSRGGATRVADLPGLDPASRIVLARRLIEETACVRVPAESST